MNKTFTNPFEIHSEQKLISTGLIALLLSSILGYFVNARFDGLLDMHFVETIKSYQPFLDNSINVLISAIILFAVGKFINPKTRFVDILAISLVARIPYYPLLLVNINDFMSATTALIVENSDPQNIENLSLSALVIILAFALIALGALIWYIILLYRGFKVATNAKGKSALGYFITAIILIEITTKFSISYLN